MTRDPLAQATRRFTYGPWAHRSSFNSARRPYEVLEVYPDRTFRVVAMVDAQSDADLIMRSLNDALLRRLEVPDERIGKPRSSGPPYNDEGVPM